MEYEAARGRETRSGWASLIKRLLNMSERVEIIRKTCYYLIVGRAQRTTRPEGQEREVLTMTNLQIIENAKAALVMNGIITPDQDLHTFNGWKERGFKVKRGEHAIARFSIWKHATRKTKDDDGVEVEAVDLSGRCFLKESCWFSDSQVEPVA